MHIPRSPTGSSQTSSASEPCLDATSPLHTLAKCDVRQRGQALKGGQTNFVAVGGALKCAQIPMRATRFSFGASPSRGSTLQPVQGKVSERL